MRPRGAALLVAITLSVALTPAVAGAQDGPSVTVEPTVGLVDQQRVSLSGQDFGANVVVGLAQCSRDVISNFQSVNEQCFLANAISTNTSPTGSFGPFDLVVRRYIKVGTDIRFQRSIDCAEPDACIVGAAVLGNLAIRAFRTVSFDPNAPSDKPVELTLSVDPLLRITNRGTLSITGTVTCSKAVSVQLVTGVTQFDPSTNVILMTGAGTAEVPCDGTTPFILEAEPSITDVAEPWIPGIADGYVSATAYEGQYSSYVDLYDTWPVVGVPETTVAAEPSVGLRNGQEVSVTGSGFLPIVDLGDGPQQGRVSLTVCLAPAPGNPLDAAERCSSSSSSAPVAPDGRFSASVTAFRTSTSVTGTSIDCTTGPDACVLFAHQIVGPPGPQSIPEAIGASVPISFRAERFSDCRDGNWTTYTDGKGRHFRKAFACYVYVFVSKLRQHHDHH